MVISPLLAVSWARVDGAVRPRPTLATNGLQVKRGAIRSRWHRRVSSAMMVRRISVARREGDEMKAIYIA